MSLILLGNLMLQIYEGTWIEKQKKSMKSKKKKREGSVMLSGALMILYCFKKVKVLITAIPGIILSVMVRRGILGVSMTSINFILHCHLIE